MTDQEGGGDADHEVECEEADDSADDSIVDVTDAEVVDTESVDSANSDKLYLQTPGASCHDAGFQPSPFDWRTDPSSGDIPSLPPPLSHRMAISDSGSADEPSLGLTVDPSTLGRVEFASNSNFESPPRPSKASRTAD